MVPRDIIVAEICDGLASPGITAWSPVAVGFDDTLKPYEYSLELALDHMEAAGFDVPSLPTPTPSTTITPTTIISGIAFSSIIGSFLLGISITVIIRFRKRQNN